MLRKKRFPEDGRNLAFCRTATLMHAVISGIKCGKMDGFVKLVLQQEKKENSVWHKGNRKMQIMIWRIESGKTGYSKGEITGNKQGMKK